MKRYDMKVLMLGWEYPPDISGGLGIASQGVARGLTQSGIDVDFVLPQTKGLKSTNRLQLLDANDYPTKGMKIREVLDEISEEISVLRIGTKLMPYMTTEEFEEVARETIKKPVRKEVAEEVVLKKFNLKGGYGPDLFQEIAKYALAVTNVCKDKNYDIIHAHDWMTFEAAVMTKAASNAKLVLHVHSTEFDRSAYRIDPAVFELEQKCLKQADAVVVVSDRVKKTLIKNYGLKSSSIHVVHNAIATSEVKLKVTPRTIKQEPKVLFVGRLTDQKGPSRFVDIAFELSRLVPGISFTIAGDGYLKDELKQKVDDLQLTKQVKFKGFLSHTRVLKLMSEHDLMLIPSIAEPFNLVALEAGLAGLPTIISREAGVSELVKSLKTIPYWDTHTWVKEAKGLLEKPSRATQMAARVNLEVKRLNWKLVGEQIKEIYAGLN
ncbi:MAG: glycosyltransferase family 4 protein [Bacteroidota bacterium]